LKKVKRASFFGSNETRQPFGAADAGFGVMWDFWMSHLLIKKKKSSPFCSDNSAHYLFDNARIICSTMPLFVRQCRG
jgi:hypothetical protein